MRSSPEMVKVFNVNNKEVCLTRDVPEYEGLNFKLNIESLNFYYGNVKALRGIDLKIL